MVIKGNNQKFLTGFTLIELLIVIAIIGLLASIVMVSLNSARAKARDTKRVGDLRNLMTALEMYYDAHNFYPASALVSNCDGNVAFNTALAALVSEGFLTALPVDPKGNWPYCYFYEKPAAYSLCPGAASHDYLIIFSTEKSTFSSFEKYNNQGEGGNAARYCLYP